MRKAWMLGTVAVVCLFIVGPTFGQDDSTYESTTVTAMEFSDHYIRSPLFFDDADPQQTHTMDFRLRFGYTILDGSAARGNDDAAGIGLGWHWGPCENVEVFADVPFNLGDGGNTAYGGDGNYDLRLGLLYRFWDEADWYPAFALKGTLRAPTGYRSNGFDAELRGILTKTLVGELRGHVNAFAITVNGNNGDAPNSNWWGLGNWCCQDELTDARNFQWGFVFGIDAPLTPAKDLWIMADYINRSSIHNGFSNMNMFEAGMEWKMTDVSSVHFTTQVGLDYVGDTPVWGAKLAYTYALTY